MLAEEKKSIYYKIVTEISAIWMLASLMFVMDIAIIYLIGNINKTLFT